VIVLCNIREPKLNRIKTGSIAHIVHKQKSHRATVECSRDAMVSLLACTIPHLKLDSLLFNFKDLLTKVDSYGRYVRLVERVLGESRQDSAFPYRAKVSVTRKRLRAIQAQIPTPEFPSSRILQNASWFFFR
jgi:hypothetical protein